MKLLECSRDELLLPLQMVSGIVERRQTLPILSNVLIERNDSGVSVLATDLEIQICSRSHIGTQTAPSTVTTSARKLQDILRALPAEAKVSLESTANRLQLKSGRSRFTLQTLPAEDFPRLAAGADVAAEITLPQRTLRSLLLLVQYAMAQQDIRYYLNGLLLCVEANELRVVATDGHRLAFASAALEHEQAHHEVVLPRKAVLELSKLLAESDEPLRIALLGAQVRFNFGSVELFTKIVDGKFPDYVRVIPTTHQNIITVERVTLLQALQRAAILSNDKFRGVRWVLTENSLRVSCNNNEQEEAQEELELEYSGIPIDIGFNVNYLLDVLNSLSGTHVCCAFGDASSSVLMTDPGLDHFKYVIMPMRI
ncbi:MAG: DNA polymerase III subunit beta [Burkholderiales bacterium]|nr:DNA polymerase III subunit beta [Burkholderiales bacterium]